MVMPKMIMIMMGMADLTGEGLGAFSSEGQRPSAAEVIGTLDCYPSLYLQNNKSMSHGWTKCQRTC